MSVLKTVLVWPLQGLIRLYQWTISPMLGPRCRFYPSCSDYAIQSLARFGPLGGVYLSLRRLIRCHPWNDGGVDEVPDTLFGGGRWPRSLRERTDA